MAMCLIGNTSSIRGPHFPATAMLDAPGVGSFRREHRVEIQQMDLPGCRAIDTSKLLIFRKQESCRKKGVFLKKSKIISLGGDFNPFDKYARQIG